METFDKKRADEIVGSLRVCAGGHCTEQDEENTCPCSCGDETCLKKQQEDAANLIESLQAQLADKTTLLNAAIAGQETIQKALNESQRRERVATEDIERGTERSGNPKM